MNTTHGHRTLRKGQRRWPRLLSALCPWSFLLCTAAGCSWDDWHLTPQTPPPPGATDSLVLHGDQLETEALPTEGAAGDLGGAHELFRRGDFDEARKHFHRIAENTKNTPQIAEEARFYEAECLRRLQKYPKAVDTYNRLLMDFPSGVHREQAVRHMLDISQYWLKDTDEEIKAEREKKAGKRWFSWPAPFVHFDKTKPFFDEEGRALEALEHVKQHDVYGPTADKALFLAGSVKFFRQDYREADYFFTQLVEQHRNSPLASRAVELAIISKHMGTGGADYDGRKVAEARELVQVALRSYPDLAAEQGKFLEHQMVGINYQQAQKDYRIAEFYRRTKHPGAAYFYYEIVRRRYPGTEFAESATKRMNDLRVKLEKEQASKPQATAPTAQPAPTAEQAPMPKRLSPDAGMQKPEIAPAPRPLPTIK